MVVNSGGFEVASKPYTVDDSAYTGALGEGTCWPKAHEWLRGLLFAAKNEAVMAVASCYLLRRMRLSWP